MITNFTKEEAIDYCTKHNINLLKSNINFRHEGAIFKLFSVSEDLLLHYVVEGLEVADDYIITPHELLVRESNEVLLDTSEVRMISTHYVDLSEE